ncbi:MAG: sensor histidine kinase, partial [Acidobacteria bacterium]
MVGAVLVFHDATERRRARQSLMESEAKLVGANRAKDDFLATLSHELRTPMNAILGWAHMLVTRSLDLATRDRGLQSILRSAQAQARLVTDLLDVSRIVRGTLTLNVRPVDLTGVLFGALDTARPTADAKHISLTLSVSATSVMLNGDGDRLQQAVLNLVDNALRATPAGGNVCVRAGVEGGDVVLTVQDEGPGLSAEESVRAFEPYVHSVGAYSASRQEPGGGT